MPGKHPDPPVQPLSGACDGLFLCHSLTERVMKMAHAKTIISGGDLANKLADYEGCPAGTIPLSEAPINRAAWYVVSWPEHVRSPRFNSDADYTECATRAEAEEFTS